MQENAVKYKKSCKNHHIGTSFFYETRAMQILIPVGSAWFWTAPDGSEWFWPMLEGPMGLRRVPYDPETFSRLPQHESGIGNGPKICILPTWIIRTRTHLILLPEVCTPYWRTSGFRPIRYQHSTPAVRLREWNIYLSCV